MHQVARAGRFGTKGLAITFVSDEKDAKILNEVQDRFEVNVGELPEEIDLSTYSKYTYAPRARHFTCWERVITNKLSLEKTAKFTGSWKALEKVLKKTIKRSTSRNV